MTNSKTYGERFAQAIREYLTANSLKSLGGINAKILAELAQDFHDKNTAVVKRQIRMADEGEWVKELEADPLFRGIDVKQELGKMQWWCKQNDAMPTRRRFTKWLMRALNDGKLTRSYDGSTSKPPKPIPPPPRYSLDKPVPGWPLILRNQLDYPEAETDALCASDWHDLPVPVREKIIHAA